MSDSGTQRAEFSAVLKLTWSAERLEKELLAASEDFATAIQRDSVGRLFERVVAESVATHRAVRERLVAPFSMMVMGDFKRGKSTLINALTGHEVAPVDVGPETISINRIQYAEKFEAYLETSDGGQASLLFGDLKRERIEPFLRRLSTPLRHLRVGAPSEMLKRVTLIDTPGLGDLFQEFDQAVREYLEQADTIIYVLSATSPLSRTEQDFLLTAIKPRHFARVFFVVNAIDLLASRNEDERVFDLIRGRVADLMPGASLYGVSALDEWSRLSGGTRPNPARSLSLEQSFAEFRRDLDAAIQFRQRYYVLDRAAWVFAKGLDQVDRHTTDIEAALQRDNLQLADAVAAIERRLSSEASEFEEASGTLERAFETLKREAEMWMSEFLTRIERECFAGLSGLKTAQIRQHLPFFLKDRLRRAIEACLASHRGAIAELFESYADGVSKDSTALVPAPGSFAQAAPVPELRWTPVQTAELVAQMLQIETLIQAGLAIVSRQMQEIQSVQLAEGLARSLPQLQDEVCAQVRDAYAAVRDALVQEWKKIVESGLRDRLEEFKQAVRVRESGGAQIGETQTTLGEIREAAGAARSFLERFQAMIWSGIE